MNNQQTQWSKFSVLISVFFFWGFIAASNNILIPLYKDQLNLSQYQAQLIDSAFYGAYFSGSVIYFIINRLIKQDLLNKIGFKNGIVYGLLISTIGSILFYPAANSGSFILLLTALFIVGLGFSLQQTSAQPFAIALGSPQTGSQRLNMAGGINNLGTTIGPAVVSLAIFGVVQQDKLETVLASVTLESVKVPYLIIGLAFLIVAMIFKFSNLPKVSNEEEVETGFGALKHPQLVLGMVAIFTYVGVEVSVVSNLGEYLKNVEGVSLSEVALWVSLYWVGLMIGRWTGSVGNFKVKGGSKIIVSIIVAFTAYLIYLLINNITGNEVSATYPYILPILVMLLAYFISQDRPSKMQFNFALLGAIYMLIGIFASGKLALFAIVSGGLCCSIMWPSIFHLSVAGLGKYTSQGSAFLIMMILGGGIIPPIQGIVADQFGIKTSYLVPFICFVFLTYYAILAKRILTKRGIVFEEKISGGGGH